MAMVWLPWVTSDARIFIRSAVPKYCALHCSCQCVGMSVDPWTVARQCWVLELGTNLMLDALGAHTMWQGQVSRQLGRREKLFIEEHLFKKFSPPESQEGVCAWRVPARMSSNTALAQVHKEMERELK